MIVETGHEMKDRNSVLFKDRKFVLAITSKPAMGHNVSAYAVGRWVGRNLSLRAKQLVDEPSLHQMCAPVPSLPRKKSHDSSCFLLVFQWAAGQQ
jgi:hypothetical protein